MGSLRYITVLLLTTSLCAGAQDNDFKDRFEAFRQQTVSRHDNFRNQCNKSYADFLEKAWESYSSVKVEKPRKEKPLPPVSFNNAPVKDGPVVIKDTVRTVPVQPRPEPVEPVKVKPRPMDGSFSFDFYGDRLTVRADRDRMFRLASTSEKDASKAWNELSSLGYESVLEDCLKLRDAHNYCDWAYLQMVYSFATAFTGNEDKAVILSAWLLCQSGYKIRLARSGGSLCLLFASDYTIFGANCFTIDGTMFYCMNSDAGTVEIADACRFPNEKGLSFAIREQVLFGITPSPERKLKSAKYSSLAVTSSVNTNLLKFLSTYPDTQYGGNYMTRWAIYADSPIDDHCKEKIYPPLKAAISGKNELESANILLNFVQTVFKYEPDDKVWGHDRIFFAEETLYYDYCDCEDRAILFSRLVRDLLGLDVVLVYYPGHLATAVKFNEEVRGDCFAAKDGKYVVCDPTYIGAPVGATTPGMEGKEASVILLNR